MEHLIAKPNRRQFIAVSAAAAGLLLTRPVAAHVQHFIWKGIALGAEAQIQLIHSNELEARTIIRACRAEINRLENIFSLYRPDSALSRLNRYGELIAPELELVELLSMALQISQETAGAFDVTVQPLWNLYSSGPPDPQELAAALQLVGHENISLSTQSIHLEKEGMQLTLNGIAQGYITDRISALLKRSGYGDALVHLGETIGMGSKPDGETWKASIEGTTETIDLTARGIATSDTLGRTGLRHLFDPRTGRPVDDGWSVTVAAPTAAIADALSTAFSFMEWRDIVQVLSYRKGVNVTLVNNAGLILKT